MMDAERHLALWRLQGHDEDPEPGDVPAVTPFHEPEFAGPPVSPARPLTPLRPPHQKIVPEEQRAGRSVAPRCPALVEERSDGDDPAQAPPVRLLVRH